MIRAPSSRAAALLRGGSSRSWRRLPLGRRFRSPRIRAAWAEGGREKLRRQLEPGGQRGGPWPHRPHWIHPSCGWSWHPVDAAPQWAAAPRLRRLQMLQRRGGDNTRVFSSRFSGNVGHFLPLLAPPTVGAPRAGLGGAPRLPASSARAPARTALRPFSLLGSFGGLARSAPYLPPCIQSACKRAVTFVHARCERSTRRCTPSSSCCRFERCRRASACFTPCTCFNLHAFATPALPLTRSSQLESSMPRRPSVTTVSQVL